MKRKMILTSCVCMSVLLSGCGSNTGSQQVSQTPSVNDVLEAGMQAHVAKPVDIVLLKKTLASVLAAPDEGKSR